MSKAFNSKTKKYDASRTGADWCSGCVFEGRTDICDQDAERCKKVMVKYFPEMFNVE